MAHVSRAFHPFRYTFPAFAAFLLAAITSSVSAASGPKLVVANPAHDGGTVAQGEALRVDYKISNPGDALLEIHDVQPTCGCTTAGDWPHQLKPGESGTIPIKLDTSHFVGQVIKTVVIRSNDREHPEVVVSVKATIWTPITLSNQVLVIPELSDPAQPARGSVTVRSEVEDKLTLSDLKSDNPRFEAAVKEVIPGKEYELTVTTVPPMTEGTTTGRITLATSNPKMPELSVPVVATVPPAVQVAPTEIAFSAPKLTAPENRFAVVLNHRAPNLQVSDVTTNASGVQIKVSAQPERKQVMITLTFPAGFEPKSTEPLVVRGKTNHPSVPSFEIPIVYTGP